jgi:hypothetical protein
LARKGSSDRREDIVWWTLVWGTVTLLVIALGVRFWFGDTTPLELLQRKRIALKANADQYGGLMLEAARKNDAKAGLHWSDYYSTADAKCKDFMRTHDQKRARLEHLGR